MKPSVLVQATLERQHTLWRPIHSEAAEAWLRSYRQETKDLALDPHRFVEKSSGLSHRDIHSIINDRSLGERFFEVHSDMLDPENSYYIDPFFGILRGQRAIRAWLVPIMSAQAAGASFDPVTPAVFMDDGEGGTSIDEWELTQWVDGQWVKVMRGVSVRRYRDGWIRDAVDFFDTMPIRMGMMVREKQGERVIPLPDWPHVPTKAWQAPSIKRPLSAKAAQWRKKTATAQYKLSDGPTGLSNQDLHDMLFEHQRSDGFYEEFAALLHPSDATYVDPIFGEVKGRLEIAAWLKDIMPKTGNIEFEYTEKPVFDKDMSYSEWRQIAILPSGERIIMTRGCSIRKYRDGWVVYAADYFDTAPFNDPEIQAASKAAGSTLGEKDILKYRKDITPDRLPDQETDTLGLAPTSAPSSSSTNLLHEGEELALREKLIEVATQEIDRTGDPTISIRNISRLAGISHNAPYFHFKDKNDLLQAVAAKAFWALFDDMKQASKESESHRERHQKLGVGYIRFATAHPGLFRLISSSDIAKAAPTPELRQARTAAAQLFGTAVLDMTRHSAPLGHDPTASAILGWSLVQGLAHLINEGQVAPSMIGKSDPLDMIEFLTSKFTNMLFPDPKN